MFVLLQKCLQNRIRTDENAHKCWGYNNPCKFREIAEKFLATKNLFVWLDTPCYDFTNTALSFVWRFESFFDSDILGAYIDKTQLEIQKHRELLRAYIRIKTNFRRTSQPIHVLAFAQGILYWHFANSKRLIYLSKSELLRHISRCIKRHFRHCEGKLPVWGTVTGYELHLRGKIIHFDTNGQRISDISAVADTNPRASLSVGSKTITGA